MKPLIKNVLGVTDHRTNEHYYLVRLTDGRTVRINSRKRPLVGDVYQLEA